MLGSNIDNSSNYSYYLLRGFWGQVLYYTQHIISLSTHENLEKNDYSPSLQIEEWSF